MNANKRIIIFTFLTFLIQCAFMIIYFNSKINESFSYLKIDKQLEINNLALDYYKKLNLNNAEYDIIVKNRAYLSLLTHFGKEIKIKIIFSVIFMSAALFLIIIFTLSFYLKNSLKPLNTLFNSLDYYLNNNKILKIQTKNERFKKTFEEFNNILEKFDIAKKKDIAINKYNNWQSFAKIVFHEIKNKLSPINLNVDSLLYYNNLSPNIEELKDIKKNIVKIEDIIAKFRDLTNLPTPKIENLNLEKIVKKIIEDFDINDKVELILRNQLDLIGDEFYWELIITNFIKNSVEAKATKFTIEITENSFSIADNGMGIEDKNLNKIWNCAFTTKKSGDGIGLFFIMEICNMFNYKISLFSEPNKETKFIIYF